MSEPSIESLRIRRLDLIEKIRPAEKNVRELRARLVKITTELMRRENENAR